MQVLARSLGGLEWVGDGEVGKVNFTVVYCPKENILAL